jgi:hypothetical protein
MALLNQIRTSITAILLITTLMISSMTTLNLQQASAFGFVERQQITDFLKLTAQFEKGVIGAVSPPEPDKIAQFRQLTGQWKSDVINAVLQNPPEPDKILRLHSVYASKVLAIFLGGPDTIPGLLDAYSQGVIEIFGLAPR